MRKLVNDYLKLEQENKQLVNQLNEAQSLIFELFSKMGESMETDMRLWLEIDKYCKEYQLAERSETCENL